jgi:hypothetical protein
MNQIASACSRHCKGYNIGNCKGVGPTMKTSGFEGGCGCGEVRYRLQRRPLFIHCCHCSWCQRETGSAFALNGLLEADELALLRGRVEVIDTPSNSGRGQQISRCPSCKVALWSNYGAAKDAIHFIRIGTLDEPQAFAPDIHIFTSSKLPWLNLADTAPVMAEYYDWKEHWPEESIRRYRRALEQRK